MSFADRPFRAEHFPPRPAFRQEPSRPRIPTASPQELQAQRLDPVREQHPCPPPGWEKPAYPSDDYRDALYLGWISREEHHADKYIFQQRQRRAQESHGRLTWRSRADRPAPAESAQFAPAMSTTAARDQRLTHGAKALLQIVHAHCGKTGWWRGTKTFLAKRMGLSPRTIQRYLRELHDLDYLLIDIEQSARTGLVTGLVFRVAARVFSPRKAAQWAETVGKLGKTELTTKKGGFLSLIKYCRSLWRLKCCQGEAYGNPGRFLESPCPS